MTKKMISTLLVLSMIFLLGSSLFLTAFISVKKVNASESEEEVFDFYSSSSESMTYENGVLTTSSNAEQKAIYTSTAGRTFDISFVIAPTAENGAINGGLYFFADKPSNSVDGITALNVNVDKKANERYYKVYIYEFTDGKYSGAVSNTIPLLFDKSVKVRVIVDEVDICVYLDGDSVPSITKKIASTDKAGTKIGFRGYLASQTISDIKISTDAEQLKAPTVKVLMIGNSYAEDCMTYTHEIARADGINMVCGVLYYGGCTVRQHSEFIEKGSKVYTYFKNGGTDRSGVDFYDVLYDEEWDYITIQTGNGEQGLESTFYPYLPKLIALIENKLPAVEIGLFESWALPECYQGTGNSRLLKYDDSSQKMYENIVLTFNNLKNDNGIRFVVPSAEGFYRVNKTDVCDNSVASTSFFRDNIGHANESGRYMLGLEMYKTITGKDILGNKFVPGGLTYGTTSGPNGNVRGVIQEVVDKLFDDYESVNHFYEEKEPQLERIEVYNAKTQYTAGEYFDYGNMIVKAFFDDGSEKEVTYYTINVLRKLDVVDTEVIVKYRDKTATVSIKVK